MKPDSHLPARAGDRGRKARLLAVLGIVTLGMIAGVGYVRTHPLVFNESFWGHAHCIKGAGSELLLYANEHHGQFPSHPNGYADALLLVNGSEAGLTGPGYDPRVFARVRRTGENAPEHEFGRVYVQGLSITNDSRIAILFDKLPTPGGDHRHFLGRIFAPLGRETLNIGGEVAFIPESRWPAYVQEQIQLLVKAGWHEQDAQRYYTHERAIGQTKP